MYILKVKQPKGKTYLAGFSSQGYVARLVKEDIHRQAPHLEVELLEENVRYPFFVLETDNKFSFQQTFENHLPLQPEPDFSKIEADTLYTIDQDWWPNQIGMDLMGYLDHEHPNELREMKLEAFNNGEACCEFERRDMNGGCLNCGAPGL